MENQIQELKKQLSNSKSVLILLPAVITTDVISACLSIYEMSANLMKKDTLIGSSVEIPTRFKKLCDDFGIQEKFILRELKPLQYIFSLPDVEKEMSVDLKREDGRVSLSLTPAKSIINPSMLSFAIVGEKFDTVIAIGVKNLEAIGHFYKKELFDSFNIVNIDQGKFNTQFGKLNIVDNKASSVSEVVYDIYKSMGIKIDGKVADTLYKGTLAGSRVLKNINSVNLFKHFVDMAEFAHYSEVVDDYLYSLSPQGLNLRARMFKNMKIDSSNRVVWSKISDPEFKEIGVQGVNLIGMDYLPYDVCEGYSKSVLIYEVGAGKTNALIFGHDKKVEKIDKCEVYQNGDIVDIRGNIPLTEMENILKNIVGVSFQSNKPSNEKSEPKPEVKNNEEKPKEPVKESKPEAPKSEPKPETNDKPFIVEPMKPFTKAAPEPVKVNADLPKFGPQPPFKKAE